MISKLIVWGPNRSVALGRLRRALAEYRIQGIQTTLPFFTALLDDIDFQTANYDTGFLTAEKMDSLLPKPTNLRVAEIVAVIAQYEKDLQSKPKSSVGTNQSKWKWSYR